MNVLIVQRDSTVLAQDSLHHQVTVMLAGSVRQGRQLYSQAGRFVQLDTCAQMVHICKILVFLHINYCVSI